IRMQREICIRVRFLFYSLFAFFQLFFLAKNTPTEKREIVKLKKSFCKTVLFHEISLQKAMRN
ncbi:MAG: hypothetical protein LUG17_02305, partial [Clostridiales bacterium]|nr:hypothetical protein [Clostridiales bacterium]